MRFEGTALVATITAAIVSILAAVPVLAEIEEVNHFESLAGLVAGSDVVMLGDVVSVTERPLTDDEEDCSYVGVRVAIESVLSYRSGAYPGHTAMFVDFECGTGIETLMDEYRNQRAVFFGSVSDAPIPAWPRAHWIPVIEAGHVHDRNGHVGVPQPINADFLAR